MAHGDLARAAEQLRTLGEDTQAAALRVLSNVARHEELDGDAMQQLGLDEGVELLIKDPRGRVCLAALDCAVETLPFTPPPPSLPY